MFAKVPHQVYHSRHPLPVLCVTRKCNAKAEIMISNWTRHVKNCIKKKKSAKSKQFSLASYFKGSSSKNKLISSQDLDSSSDNNEDSKNASCSLDPDDLKSSTDMPTLQPFVIVKPSDIDVGKNENASEQLTLENHDDSEFQFKKVKLDWSSATRKQMKKLQPDKLQPKITDFYSIIEQLDIMARTNSDLLNALNAAKDERINTLCKYTSLAQCEDFGSFFKQLLSNAESNVSKLPNQRRHDEIIKKFSCSLFLYAGPMAYNFIHSNIPVAIPSLRTVQRVLQSDYHMLSEGEFQFDELVNHLRRYNAPPLVSISEDATRIISRIEYCNRTNRLVGFSLPCNNDGLPIPDSFLATSPEAIENAFKTQTKCKYAHVYMAQAVAKNIPAFCLACIGSTNCFTAEDVLRRWKYIHEQCQQRKISVISFGADGDSRELRAMKISYQFKIKQPVDKFHVQLLPSLDRQDYPKAWTWFWVKRSTPLVYIQDYVHVAVKLKTRLLKPSIILPMGNFTAGPHHLSLLYNNFEKDQHGMRLKDIDCRDRQNYEAVLHITSPSVFSILEKIPDAKGTIQYLRILRYFIDGFLDKSLTAQDRIKKVWYVVFFLHFWNHWISSQKPQYCIRNNFITSNAYSCIELNAHALIMLIRMLRDNTIIQDGGLHVLPWLLGSQPCEKAFRAVRSMTSTFSTVINFSLLDLLNRLHRLYIQLQLEAQSEQTGIEYPRCSVHKVKEGHHNNKTQVLDPNCNLNISDKEINMLVQQAKLEAKESANSLGMFFEEKDGTFDSKPDDENEFDKDDDNDDNIDDDMNGASDNENLKETIEHKPISDRDNLTKDLTELEKIGVVENEFVKNYIKKTQKSSLKRMQSVTIPMYEPKLETLNQTENKYSPFLELEHNGKVVSIRKTTLVWVFQQTESISADRLFRVRNKQPYSTCLGQPQSKNFDLCCSTSDIGKNDVPTNRKRVKVGDVCVFRTDGINRWRLGKVLQFSYLNGKSKKVQQYIGLSADLGSNIGVLCSWFNWHPPMAMSTFMLSTASIHEYIPLDAYMCTLTEKCFDSIEADTVEKELTSIIATSPTNSQLISSKLLKLSGKTVDHIEKCIQSIDPTLSKLQSIKKSDAHDCNLKSKKDRSWKQYGCYNLTELHKSQLSGGHLLDDIHINAAQAMLKQQFPEIGGFCNTLMQHSHTDGMSFFSCQSLQIVFVAMGKVGHWIGLSTLSCKENEIEVYDTLQNFPSLETQTIICRYMKSKASSVTIKLANLAAQKGSSDCGLYAIAILTTLAFGNDPTKIVYHQDEMRPHLKQCFESGTITEFPILQRRSRIRERIVSVIDCPVYCICRLPEGSHEDTMIQCDKCEQWYHSKCVKVNCEIGNRKWFCPHCC